jgi:hypothetical protein
MTNEKIIRILDAHYQRHETINGRVYLLDWIDDAGTEHWVNVTKWSAKILFTFLGY